MLGLVRGAAGSPTLTPLLGLCSALDHLLPHWACSDFSLRLLFHPPFPSPVPGLTQPTYYTEPEFFQKAVFPETLRVDSFPGEEELGRLEIWVEDPVLALTLDQSPHWPPPCGRH